MKDAVPGCCWLLPVILPNLLKFKCVFNRCVLGDRHVTELSQRISFPLGQRGEEMREARSGRNSHSRAAQDSSSLWFHVSGTKVNNSSYPVLMAA